jgi:hypothetical protein
MTAFCTSSAMSALFLKFRSVAITHLEQQITAYRTSIKKQHQKITDIEDQLELSRDLIPNPSDSLPADIIFGDLCHNRNVNSHERRYLLETLSWALEIHSVSHVACATIRAVLPFPSETLLWMDFFDCALRDQQSLTNLNLGDDLLTIWSLSNRIILDPKHQIDAILAVDAVAVRPVIAIYENAEIEEIENLNNLTSPGLFT